MTAIDPVISIVITSCLATLFGVAAAHKLRAPGVFKQSLTDYELLPHALTSTMALLFPIAELAAAIMILYPETRFYAAALMIVLLGVYTAAVGLNLYRGKTDLDCGCAGPASKQTLSGWLVVRNALLISLVFITVIPTISRTLNWMDILVIAFSILTATSIYAGLNRLFAQSRQLLQLRRSS